MLASFQFHKRNLDKALEAAQRGAFYYDNWPILAESYYQQARVYHVLVTRQQIICHRFCCANFFCC
jgi:hypothetical protein